MNAVVMPPTVSSSWPALGHETHQWHPSDGSMISRRQRQTTTGPYQAALVPAIADLPVHLPPALAAEAEEAAVEISRFDAEASHILGDREIAPIAAVLLRSESAASSQIENLTVGARQLALAEIGEEASANARTVAGNVAAMRAAVALASDISCESVLHVHAALMSDQALLEAGTWRTQQVWIGGTGAGPLQATFIPPHHAHVPGAMADLVAFTARTDTDDGGGPGVVTHALTVGLLV